LVVLLPNLNPLTRRWSVLALAAAAVALIVSGCSTLSPASNTPPAPAEQPGLSQFQQLTDALIERARRLDAMQAEGVMDYAGGGQHVKVREEVALKRPASLRVEAMSPFGVAAVVAANGATVAIYQPSDNTFYRGAATADTLSRFARIPLPPEQAVKLLMGLLPDSESNFAAPTSVRTEDGLTIGAYQMPGGSVDELGFADGQLRLVRTRGSAGVAYEVKYSDYRDIGGLQFAHQLDAKFLNTGTQLNVKYSSVIVNPTLGDGEFVLMPQGSARLIDLDQPPAGGHG
jgi:hypothetical protein